jgi:Dolichyl-phosphate-mannose-protein mannosyltransferase
MKTFFYICFAALVSLWFAYNATKLITNDAIIYDALTNVRIANHLVQTGVYSNTKTETSDPGPTMKREPVPVLVISAWLLLHPSFAAPYTIADLTDGRLTRTVKLVNVFWVFLVALFIFLLCWELFPNPITAGVVALVTLAISDATFLSTDPVVDRLFTELPATAFLLAASWCAVRFVHRETPSRAICLGIAMGLLVLTKAAFLYIGIAFILLLFLSDRLEFTRQPDARSLRQLRVNYAMLVAAFLGTLAPWIGGNHDSQRIHSRHADGLGRVPPARIDLRYKPRATEAAPRPLVGIFARRPRSRRKVE